MFELNETTCSVFVHFDFVLQDGGHLPSGQTLPFGYLSGHQHQITGDLREHLHLEVQLILVATATLQEIIEGVNRCPQGFTHLIGRGLALQAIAYIHIHIMRNEMK